MVIIELLRTLEKTALGGTQFIATVTKPTLGAPKITQNEA
jgi:hypothetical protein